MDVALPNSQEEKLELKTPAENDLVEEEDDDDFHLALEILPEEEAPVKEENTVPEGVVDFDALQANDPNACAVYVKEIFAYYRSREAEFRCPKYLGNDGHHLELTVAMRAILVDWLVEVQESFELNHETLYTAVKIMDLYLARTRRSIPKDLLQLVGATACLIACKIDERLPPVLDDFVYVCDDAYSKDSIRRMEIDMFETIGFDTGYPLTYRYLRRYGRVCQVTMPILTFARFILELSLMEYDLIDVSESLVAASALRLCLIIKGVEGWEKTLEYYSKYTAEECRGTILVLHANLRKAPHDQRRTIWTKYEHHVFHEVARTPIPRRLEI